jgi:hypothetical protein
VVLFALCGPGGQPDEGESVDTVVAGSINIMKPLKANFDQRKPNMFN